MRMESNQTRSVMADENYNLSGKIYLDINLLDDSTQIISSTILDPFESFFYYPTTIKSTAFLNMYFDIVEIQRRELLVELEETDMSPKQVERVYTNKMIELEDLTTIFFRNAERGENIYSMIRWNDYIMEGLNINNWELFGLEYEYPGQ